MRYHALNRGHLRATVLRNDVECVALETILMEGAQKYYVERDMKAPLALPVLKLFER